MDYTFSDPNNILKIMRAKKIHLLYTAALSLVILPGLADAKSRDLYFQRIKPWLDQAAESAREIKLQKAEDLGGIVVQYQTTLPWLKAQNEARGLPSNYTPSYLKEGPAPIQIAQPAVAPRAIALAPAEPQPEPVETAIVEVPLRPAMPEQHGDEPRVAQIIMQPVVPTPAPHITGSRAIALRLKDMDTDAAETTPVQASEDNREAREIALSHKDAPAPAQAQLYPNETAAAEETATDQDFADAGNVSSEDLGEIRGGFMTSNGMMIDIGLETRSIVDGVTVEHSNIKNLENIKTDDLQRLVQVNNATQSAKKLNLTDVPNLLTIIQNSRNDVKIDSFAIMNIDVSNSARFTLQTQAPELFNVQMINNLR